VQDKVRRMRREDMEKHDNPAFKIKIVPDVTSLWIADMILRIRESDDKDQKVVMLMPNPAPTVYETVAELINRFRINCRNVYTFNLDEWAN
jgi:hypothetical protein